MNKNSKLTQCTGIVLILLFSKVLKLFGLQRFGVVFLLFFFSFIVKTPFPQQRSSGSTRPAEPHSLRLPPAPPSLGRPSSRTQGSFPPPAATALLKIGPRLLFLCCPLGEGEPCRAPKALHSLHRKWTGQPTHFKSELPSGH